MICLFRSKCLWVNVGSISTEFLIILRKHIKITVEVVEVSNLIESRASTEMGHSTIDITVYEQV